MSKWVTDNSWFEKKEELWSTLFFGLCKQRTEPPPCFPTFLAGSLTFVWFNLVVGTFAISPTHSITCDHTVKHDSAPGEKGQCPFALAQHTERLWNVFFQTFRANALLQWHHLNKEFKKSRRNGTKVADHRPLANCWDTNVESVCWKIFLRILNFANISKSKN